VPAILLRSSYRQRVSLRSRVSALALALGGAALVILALIALGILPPPIPRDANPLHTFDVAPVAAPVQSVSRVVKPAGSPPPKATPKPQPTPATAPVPSPPAFIQMDSATFAATDIGKIAPAAGTSDDSAGNGKDSVAAYGPGEGPGGAPLYYAEWYREPSHAELSTYMPANGPPTGYALIACKTIAGYHVDNCRVLGETPGSGFGRAMRRAAWQFLVRPPRLGGKPLVGAWVRIRIDFTPGGVLATG
jgi:protein TonB